MKPLIAALAVVLLCSTLNSCEKIVDAPLPTRHTRVQQTNMDFEQQLAGWQVESPYTGFYGFSADAGASRSGAYGLNFYAPQSGHWPGAPQETPWNGKIYLSFYNLKNGLYTFKAYADALGEGMYVWADGGGAEAKTRLVSDTTTLVSVDFVVKGGRAKVGFICIDANGDPATFAPYFHADDTELWLNE